AHQQVSPVEEGRPLEPRRIEPAPVRSRPRPPRVEAVLELPHVGPDLLGRRDPDVAPLDAHVRAPVLLRRLQHRTDPPERGPQRLPRIALRLDAPEVAAEDVTVDQPVAL